MTNEIKELVAQQQQLAKQAIAVYTPLVDEIISTQNREENHIELTLDYMLGFCFDARMLQLYKKLYRHYWAINPLPITSTITAKCGTKILKTIKRRDYEV